jgi:hypothetical protein
MIVKTVLQCTFFGTLQCTSLPTSVVRATRRERAEHCRFQPFLYIQHRHYHIRNHFSYNMSLNSFSEPSKRVTSFVIFLDFRRECWDRTSSQTTISSHVQPLMRTPSCYVLYNIRTCNTIIRYQKY